jgi:hypothetical protein
MLHLRTTLTAISSLVATLLLATSAQAIPYFNADFGFDNSTLMLPSDYVIDHDATFPFIASGTTFTDIGLLAVDSAINDTPESIDRTITWTLINNADITEFVVFFTALGPTPHDYSGANIDIEIDGVNPMQIMEFGPFFFAGYHLNLSDFTLVDGRLEVTKTFRYTVDQPEQGGLPPALGIAYTTNFTVPEPATGLLLGGALLMVLGAGRRNTP